MGIARTIPKPSRRDAVKAVLEPGSVRPKNPPRIPSDAQFDSIEESIRVNLAYLAAASQPYYHGLPFTLDDGTNTVIWRFSRHRVTRSERTQSGYERTMDTETHYFFDADGNLLVKSRSGLQGTIGTASFTRPVIVPSDQLERETRVRLDSALREQRKQIAQSWPK